MKPIAPQSGFTLIELAVVIMLIGVTLVFAAPRLPEMTLTDPSKQTSRWIMLNVQSLKERSVTEHKAYTLHVGFDDRRLWVTREGMGEEEIETAQENGYRLPSEVSVLDVEYPDGDRVSSGRVDIGFYPAGYSDRVIIHLAHDQDRYSYQIEPFLPRVRFHEAYIGYET